MTRYVALYCRLSPRPDGSYEGVEAQERWGREYAARTWPGVPIEVFKDPGISAAGDDHRPGFERFREWLAAGRIVHVWAVEQKRIERREIQWFVLAAELDGAGIRELHTNRDGIVRVRDAVAGIKAVLAADEIRVLKQRVNETLAEKAALGRPPGAKPFGYAHGKNDAGEKTYVIIPEQAEAIRWAADRVLSGWSLSNIAAGLRERGLRGAHGGRVTANTVRAAVTMPTVVGYRVHRGHVVGRGNWPAILDEETWQACRVKLSQPRRVRRSDGGTYPIGAAHIGNPTGRRYLLTGGLAVCEVCSAPLVASMKQLRGREPRPYYLCHPSRGGRACVGILGLELEQHVVDRLFAELDKPEFLEAVAADDSAARRDEITAALQAAEGRRGKLARAWAADDLTDDEWRQARAEIAERERQLQSDLTELPPPVLNVNIAQARQAWPDMILDEQREFVRLFVERVTVRRARPGAQGFDTGRVAIDWRRR